MTTTKARPAQSELAHSSPRDVRLFTIPGSHPGVAVQRMLEYKGIAYKRTDLLPVAVVGGVRALRFLAIRFRRSRSTAGGSRARPRSRVSSSGSCPGRRSSPPIRITGPRSRRPSASATRTSSTASARSSCGCSRRTRRRCQASWRARRSAFRTAWGPGWPARSSPSMPALTTSAMTTCATTSRPSPECCSGSTTGSPTACSAAETLNAADFQIAPSLRLAMSFDDVRPAIERRPAGRLALRVVPDYPGRIPPTLPAAWLEPLLAAADGGTPETARQPLPA